MASRPALRRLVSLREDEFAAGYWGRRPLLSPATTLPDGFDDLFSLRAADELLSSRGLRTPFVRVAKDGALVDPSRFTRSGGVGAAVADQVVDDRVLELFADGHTVVLQGLHRLWPPLIDFAGRLGEELGHPVQVNAYVTPRGAQGFAAHYDVHDVFVLQVSGRKRWIVHEPVLLSPLRTQAWTDVRDEVVARAAEPPLLAVVLEPGDVLYLPRGYIHAAEALGEVCAHLTVGVQEHTRHALVEALAELVADEPELRRSLPLGIDVRDPAQLAQELAVTVESLVSRLRTITADQVAGLLDDRTRTSMRPAPLAPLLAGDRLASLDGHSTIVPRPRARTTLVRGESELELRAPAKTLRFPLSAEGAISAVLGAGAAVRVGDLPLPEAEAVDLARRLVRAGVAVPGGPVEPSPPT